MLENGGNVLVRERTDGDSTANECGFAGHLLTTRRFRHCMFQAAHLLPPATGAVVYFVGGPYGHIKIGFATTLADRIAGLQTGNPAPLLAYAYWPGTIADEAFAHKMFADDRGNGEWFQRSPRLLRAIMSIQHHIAKREGIALPKPGTWDDDDI